MKMTSAIVDRHVEQWAIIAYSRHFNLCGECGIENCCPIGSQLARTMIFSQVQARMP